MIRSRCLCLVPSVASSPHLERLSQTPVILLCISFVSPDARQIPSIPHSESSSPMRGSIRISQQAPVPALPPRKRILVAALIGDPRVPSVGVRLRGCDC
ncbi:uncharacterized protein BDV17DRAFT_101146 [Aspergillus undulatus]|uniref:uncharacterized protein n=1 Tax=Aspergillus undulatus TaxID=1810928 RepID=UPI003CCCA54F